MESGISGMIAKGEVLSDSNNQQWIVGTFIGDNGSAISYEASSFSDKAPTDFRAILLIVPSHGNEPLPIDIQFYLDYAKPKDFDDWKSQNKIKQDKHLGIPCLLGAGSHMINEANYKFIVIQRHGKDLLTLFSEYGKKFKAHTAYKITLQLITILKYTHTKLYIHGDIRTANIVLDVASQNKIYLMDDYVVASQNSLNDELVDSNIVISSRDCHMGAPTMRGDIESLFYNLVQWLGLELPWKKHFENPSLVLEEKNKAFANVQSWSKEIALPDPVCKFMELLASMDVNEKPMYHKFVQILANGLKKLNHVPYGKLEFSISNVPTIEQIVEDSDQGHEPKRRGKKPPSIPKLGNSVLKMAEIISENCKNEDEVRLRGVGPGSLIEIICDLTSKNKSNSAWQNRLANAWERDTAGLKTLTQQLWREKGLQTTGITSEAASTENQHKKRIPRSAATATAPKNTNRLNHSNPGTSNSQGREAISPDRIPPQNQEPTASFDLPYISPPHVRQTARSPSPSRWSGVQSSPIQPSSSGYSSRSSIHGDSHSEAIAFSRTPVHFYDTEHSRTPEVSVVNVKQENKGAEVQVTECRISESARCESWQGKYDKLNAWLKMREQNFSAFGSIPSEPQTMTDQVQLVQVLLDEFYPSLRLRHLKNTKLPAGPEPECLLEQIEHRWWDLQARLEKRGKELGDACCQKLRDALQGVSNDLDQLSLDNDSDEQRLSKIETLGGQLEGLQRTLLVDATAVTEQLCQALRNQAYTSDLRVQLRSAKSLHSNLQQKIAIKKAEVESSLEDGRQFNDSCKEMNIWLDKKLENILEKPPISTDRTTLQQQHDYYKVKHQRIMDNKADVMRLLEMGRNRLRPQNSTQQRFLESIESKWDDLMKQSVGIVKKFETCAECCDQYYKTQDVLLRWMSEAERKLETVEPYTLDDIGKQLEELSDIRNEVNEKSSKFEECNNLGHKFIGACDEDKNDVIKNKLIGVKNRWDELNNELLERTQSLKDPERHLTEFHKSLSELTSKLEQYDEELASHESLEVGAKDLDRIKALEMEITYLQRPLDAVRKLADDLIHETNELGIDDNSLFKLVNRVNVRIESSKAKLVKIREEILEHDRAKTARETEERKSNIKVKIESSDDNKDEVTVAIAKKFHEKEELLERWLSQAESKLESAKLASLDDIRKRLRELYELRDEVREKSSEFEQYSTLSHTLNRDGIVKKEFGTVEDRWKKLNHDLLDRLKFFEDMEKCFADFEKSLLDLQQKIESYEKESVSHDTLETAAKDLQFLQRIKELKAQMVSLQEPLDVARQQADALGLQSGKQGIDASHLLEGMNRLDVRITNLKTKFDHICIDILEQERARFVKEIQNNKPVESPSRDSSTKESENKSHSERRQDRDSESNGQKRNESSSRSRRSRSKDSNSSPPRSSSDNLKSHESQRYRDSRPNSDLNPSQPKRFRNSKDSDDRDSRSPRNDKARQNASKFRNSYSDRSPPRSYNRRRHWQKPRFDWRPYRNFDRQDRAQSVSHCDSQSQRDSDRRSSQWNFYKNRPFRRNFRGDSAYRQSTTDRRAGQERDQQEKKE